MLFKNQISLASFIFSKIIYKSVVVSTPLRRTGISQSEKVHGRLCVAGTRRLMSSWPICACLP